MILCLLANEDLSELFFVDCLTGNTNEYVIGFAGNLGNSHIIAEAGFL